MTLLEKTLLLQPTESLTPYLLSSNECIPAHLRPKGLEQGHTGVSIIVHVVVWSCGISASWDIDSTIAKLYGGIRYSTVEF